MEVYIVVSETQTESEENKFERKFCLNSINVKKKKKLIKFQLKSTF